MNFVCQKNSIELLSSFAADNKHSVLIEGAAGSGKTYLAQMYAKLLNILDFQIVSPNVQSIRNAIEDSYKVDYPTVICIENLDGGVVAASYTLLKFLEEPPSNIYIVVTCQNIYEVPDTIVSRSVCVSTSPPIDSDLVQFAEFENASRYDNLKHSRLWRCVRTFNDVQTVLAMTPEQLKYFESLEDVLSFKDSIANLIWRLGHYSDNSETPIELVIRYLLELSDSVHVKQSGIACISDIRSGRIAAHASLAQFLFECKYCR